MRSRRDVQRPGRTSRAGSPAPARVAPGEVREEAEEEREAAPAREAGREEPVREEAEEEREAAPVREAAGREEPAREEGREEPVREAAGRERGAALRERDDADAERVAPPGEARRAEEEARAVDRLAVV